MMINGNIKSAWKAARLMPGYILNVAKQSVRHLPPNDKKILFSFNDDRLFRDDDNSGREAYQIMKTFSDGGGYNVYFYRRQDFKSYYKLRKYGQLTYNIRNLKFINHMPKDTRNYIYAFDTQRPELLSFPWKNLLYVNIEKSPSFQIGNVIPIPFCMHPYIYIAKADKAIDQHRNSRRKIRIFFGGNLHKDYYDNPVFKQRYPRHLSRLEAVMTLLNSGLNVSLITEPKDLRTLLNHPDYLNQMVIFRTDHTFPVKASGWLKILSQGDFFMCFSGTSYPMCHNAIEAMSVGSIPIIAYHDWFDPYLEHGKNAIIYTNKTDLIEKVEEVLSMGQEEIKRLRREVIKYYDTYLTEQYLVRKYETEARGISTIMRFPRFVLTEQDRREGELFNERLSMQLSSLWQKTPSGEPYFQGVRE